jgi:hypothetical protein
MYRNATQTVTYVTAWDIIRHVANIMKKVRLIKKSIVERERMVKYINNDRKNQ